MDERGALLPFERRVDPAVLGHPLTAVITVHVLQQMLDEVAVALAECLRSSSWWASAATPTC